ncbi:MAG: flagellar basal-body MS-ring/collar protein FliF [Thiobacillaceae bacterium]
MGKVLTGLFEVFTSATPLRRMVLVLLLVLPVAALVAAWLWLNQPPYQVLYAKLPDRAGLSDRSGGEVMAALEQMNIPYRLSDANGAIEVPADQVYSARFKLAARGLPKPDTQTPDATDGVATFGQSQFQEQLRYQHALEAELVRSIETLQSVASARVHLALPKASPFLREPPPVTAAVLVQLRSSPTNEPGLALEQIGAIQRMVAASVPRLKPADVSVLDQQGRLLGVVANDPAASRSKLEVDLARRVIDGLSPLFGADRVKVQITATLLPQGRIRRIDAAVILALDASLQQISQANTLAQQALGLDARRGDRLSVFALPPTVVPHSIPKASPAVQTAIPEVQTPLWWMLAAGIAIALLVWLGLRGRRRPPAAENTLSESETFDGLLQSSRSQTLDNPRVTADVIRLWMRA